MGRRNSLACLSPTLVAEIDRIFFLHFYFFFASLPKSKYLTGVNFCRKRLSEKISAMRLPRPTPKFVKVERANLHADGEREREKKE